MLAIFKKYVAIITLLAILSIGILGISSIAVEMNNGSMSHCPLMGASLSMCPMKVVEHISIWQSLLAVTVPNPLNLLILFLSLLIIFIIFNSLAFTNFIFLESHQRFRGMALESQLNNQLIEIFSQGIIHPKIYLA